MTNTPTFNPDTLATMAAHLKARALLGLILYTALGAIVGVGALLLAASPWNVFGCGGCTVLGLAIGQSRVFWARFYGELAAAQVATLRNSERP